MTPVEICLQQALTPPPGPTRNSIRKSMVKGRSLVTFGWGSFGASV